MFGAGVLLGMIDQEQTRQIARKLCWWQPPEVMLGNRRRFIARVMTLGTWTEVQEMMEVFGPDAFKDALLNATAGEFDARSWAYWRNYFGLPEAELPRRSFT